MKGKSLIFVLILSLAINASVLGTMGYHYYRDASLVKDAPCPLSPAHQHLYQQLGLSTPQLAQMEPLAQKFHERLGQLETAMKGKNERLVEVIAHILESKKILDAKQQKQFFALMSQSMATGQVK
jgi:hypothetical protein